MVLVFQIVSKGRNVSPSHLCFHCTPVSVDYFLTRER